MASLAFISPLIYAHDTDLTGYLKRFKAQVQADELPADVFGNSYRTRLPGYKTVTVESEGLWDSPPDLTAFSSEFGVLDRVLTVSPEGAELKTAYLFQHLMSEYTLLGTAGEVAPFSLNGKSSNAQGIVRGQLAKAKGNVSATGQLGSVLTLTTVGALQFLYATIHIFTAGTTITIQVQSDDAIGFPSATTRATIGPLTVAGGTWMARVAGPIATDNFWRLNVSAITGTFNIAGAIGIQ